MLLSTYPIATTKQSNVQLNVEEWYYTQNLKLTNINALTINKCASAVTNTSIQTIEKLIMIASTFYAKAMKLI